MIRTIFKTSLLALIYALMALPVMGVEKHAQQSAVLTASVSSQSVEVRDTRIDKLEAYLASHNSPLEKFAETFVNKADEYGLPDWRLVPSIAGVESTFGKHIPYASYNAWGWANGAYAFEDWENAIDVVTKALKQKYVDRGLATPEQMSPVYAPPSKTWASKVQFFMGKIDEFEVRLELTDLTLSL